MLFWSPIYIKRLPIKLVVLCVCINGVCHLAYFCSGIQNLKSHKNKNTNNNSPQSALCSNNHKSLNNTIHIPPTHCLDQNLTVYPLITSPWHGSVSFFSCYVVLPLPSKSQFLQSLWYTRLIVSFDRCMIYHPHVFRGRIYQGIRLWCRQYTNHTVGPSNLLLVHLNNQRFLTIITVNTNITKVM